MKRTVRGAGGTYDEHALLFVRTILQREVLSTKHGRARTRAQRCSESQACCHGSVRLALRSTRDTYPLNARAHLGFVVAKLHERVDCVGESATSGTEPASRCFETLSVRVEQFHPVPLLRVALGRNAEVPPHARHGFPATRARERTCLNVWIPVRRARLLETRTAPETGKVHGVRRV